MSKESYALHVQEWERMAHGIAEHATELPHLQEHGSELEAVLAEARSLKLKQLQLQGELGETNNKLANALARGRDLASAARLSIKGKLGQDNPLLYKFGLNPRRGSKRSKPAPDPETAS